MYILNIRTARTTSRVARYRVVLTSSSFPPLEQPHLRFVSVAAAPLNFFLCGSTSLEEAPLLWARAAQTLPEEDGTRTGSDFRTGGFFVPRPRSPRAIFVNPLSGVKEKDSRLFIGGVRELTGRLNLPMSLNSAH
eukprot:1183785-Prorocentrum_minimum.AAC.3